MEERKSELKNIETYSAKCSSCGGTLVFDPETQSLRCEHCGNKIDVKKNRDVAERNITEGFEKAEKWDGDEQATYKCKNCGAVVVVSGSDHAALCPFCGTTHIVKEGSFSGLRPQVVIPFAFGPEKAETFAKQWAKKRIFSPRKFKRSLTADNIHGVYEPCFTFDSNAESYYEGRVGETRTRTVGSGKDRRTETYTEWYHIHGVIDHFFDDVYVAANENFNQTQMEKISPFNRDEACVYENKYLSGFVAESYRKDLKDSWEDAKKIMDLRIRGMIRNRHHYDVVDYINVSTTHRDVTYKYVLVPVYVMNYRFKKKTFEMRINGSTGKTYGKTPKSPLRVGIVVALGLAAVIGLVWLFLNGDVA